jgi:hypothetical protein
MKKWHAVPLSAALTLTAGVLLLTACGSGGGGSSEPTARPLMTLDADNAPETVQSLAVALMGDIILSDDLLPLSVEAGTAGGDRGPTPLESVQDITRQVRGLLGTGTSVGALSVPEGDRTTAQEVFVENCPLGGTLTLTENATSVSVVFDNCVYQSGGEYVRQDGHLDITNIAGTAVDACIDKFTATFRFRNLITEVYAALEDPPVESIAINGRANAEELWNDCGEPDSFRMYGSYLGFVINEVSLAYFAFDLISNDYWQSGYFEDDITLTLDVSTLPGSIDVTTPELVYQDSDADYPYDGVIRLDAANGGYLEMSILSPVYDDLNAVSIEADFNGDGIVDCQAQASWEQLENATWMCSM